MSLRRNCVDFAQFQSPKNLALSIYLDAAELLEHFHWTTEDKDIPPDKRDNMAEEVADILIYPLLLPTCWTSTRYRRPRTKSRRMQPSIRRIW